MNDPNLTPEEINIINDIKIRAMMFDMEVDWETLQLIPKQKKHIESVWLHNWRAKEYAGDRQPQDYEGGE